MEIKTRGIVLRTVKYGDNKLIADLLTREGGRVSVAVKTGSSAKNRTKRQLFQPLTILDTEISQTPRQQIAQLREAHIGEVYTTIPYDGVKMSIAFFTAEFLSLATRDLHTDPYLYDFLEQSFLWLDASERGTANFHLMLMMHLTRFLGFQPDTESFCKDSFFDLREGRFCTTAPVHPDFLNKEEAQQMLMLLRMSAHNVHLFHLSRDERNRITDFILRFYNIHIPSFHELKSLAVLREL